MSVYSGFATRQQQTKYNSLLQNLVLALKKRVVKFYRQEPCDQDKFKLLIKKIYKKMFVLERGKFMIPKYSTCFADLIAQLGIEIDYDNISDASSIISQSFTVAGEKHDDNQISTNINGEFLRSRSLLENKKNSIEMALKRDRGSIETFMLSKRHLDGLDSRDAEISSRGSSLDTDVRNRALARLRRKELRALETLRATSNFPKVQDFMPKPDELPRQMLFQSPPKKPELKQVKQHRSFRRHKFDVDVQDL